MFVVEVVVEFGIVVELSVERLVVIFMLKLVAVLVVERRVVVTKLFVTKEVGCINRWRC